MYPNVLELRARADGYVSKTLSIDPSKQPYIFVLEKTRSFHGVVRDSDGFAVADVAIAAVDYSGDTSTVPNSVGLLRNMVKSDAEGKFTCIGVQSDIATLLARKEDGSSGILARADAKDDREHIIVLRPPTTVALEIVDQAGKSLEGALVSWIAWESTLPMEAWSKRSDAEGKIVWNTAPQGRLWLTVEYPQLRPKHISIDTSSPTQREQKVALDPIHQLHVTAVDKLSQEPIEDFSLRIRYNRSTNYLRPGESFPMATGMPGSRSYRGVYEVQGKQGEANVRSILDFESLSFSVAAPGYKISDTQVVQGSQAISELAIQLEPLSDATAIVHDPSGNVAQGAIVFYTSAIYNFEFDERVRDAGVLPSSTQWVGSKQSTDELGRFLLDWNTSDKCYAIWHETGWSCGTVESLIGQEAIELSPWGSVSIQGITETQWASGNFVVSISVPNLNNGRIKAYLEIPLNQFPIEPEIELTRVPTGSAILIEKKQFENVVMYEPVVPFEVKPSETTKVAVRGTASFEGTVEFRGDVPATPPSSNILRLKLKRVDEKMNVASVFYADLESDGSFIVAGLLPGRYAVQIEQLDRTRPEFRKNRTDPYGYMNSSMAMESVVEIREGEHKEGGVVTAYMFKRPSADAKPKGSSRRFVESPDSFVSSVTPRFLVKTKPPDWYKQFESSPSEKFFFVSESGKIVREIGIEEIRMGIVSEPLVNLQDKSIWLRMNGGWKQFDFSGKRRGAVDDRASVNYDKMSGRTWFNCENQFWEFNSANQSVQETKYQGRQMMVGDDQSVWTSDTANNVKRYDGDGSSLTVLLAKNGNSTKAVTYDRFRNGCWFQVSSNAFTADAVTMNIQAVFASAEMEVKPFLLGDGKIIKIVPSKDSVVVHFLQDNVQDTFYKIDWGTGQIEKIHEDTDRYFYVDDPDGKTSWRRTKDGLEQIEVNGESVTVLKEVAGIPPGTVYVLPSTH